MTMRNDPELETAEAIADYLLETTGAAYMARDFDKFLLCFNLPQPVGTFSGDRVIETADEVREVFDAICAQFDARGVLDLRRKTLHARFLDPDTVETTFISQMVMRGYQLSDETTGHSLLGRVDGRWKILDGRYATTDTAIARALSRTNRR